MLIACCAMPAYMQRVLVKEIPFAEVLVGELGFEMEGLEVEVDGDREVVKVYATSRCSLLLSEDH